MRKMILFLFIFLIGNAFLHSSEIIAKIHSRVADYRLKVFQNGENVSIEVLQNSIKKQTLSVEGVTLNYSETSQGLFKNGIWLEDFNFDGYKDIAALVTQGVTGNFTVKVFLYQVQQKRFVYHPGFSSIPSPRLNKRQGLILGFEKGGAAGLIFKRVTYRVVQGQPVLIKRVIQDVLKSNDYQYFKRSISELVNGRMTLVCEFVVTVEGCTVKPVKILKGTQALAERYLRED